MARFSAFLMGVLFALGLGVSGMTQPQKVMGFLDLTGDWDPALAFVMGGALIVNGMAWRFLKGRGHSLFAGAFSLPQKTRIDGRLLLGAGLFGVGWGIGGLCPGPALTSLAFFSPEIIFFVVAMTFGMLIGNALRENAVSTDAAGNEALMSQK